jgi:uncharacterized protein (TIGR03382 family)
VIARALALALAAAAAAPALAYERSRSDTSGAPLAWPVPVVPYHVSATTPYAPSPGCAPAGARDPAAEAVVAGFSAWHQGCSSLELAFAGRIDERRVGLQGTAENLVVFRQGWCRENAAALADGCLDDPDVDCGNLHNCFEDATPADRFVVALTSVLYDPDGGRIFDADIEVNGWDGVGAGEALDTGATAPRRGWYFTCEARPEWTAANECARYGDADCFYIDLQSTMAHEAGHFIGLAHVCEQGTCQPGQQDITMYPATSPGDVDKRTLHEDDVAGVCAIYPDGGDGGGCSTGGSAAAGPLAAVLVLAALRRRRRPA